MKLIQKKGSHACYLFKSFRLYLHPFGDVAQLARALGWQPRGRGFEPHLLHVKKAKTVVLAFLFVF